MHRKVAAALIAAFALALTGCGGSEETLAREQLVTRIEAACRLAQRTQEEALNTVRGSTGAAKFLAAVLVGQKAAMARLEDLHPADEDEADFDAFKQGMQDRVALFEKVDTEASARSVQNAIAAAAAAGEAISRRLAGLARRLEVEGCA